MTYPKSVAQEIAALRPDLCANDAVSVALTADPTLTADEAIAILDEATAETSAEQ